MSDRRHAWLFLALLIGMGISGSTVLAIDLGVTPGGNLPLKEALPDTLLTVPEDPTPGPAEDASATAVTPTELVSKIARGTAPSPTDQVAEPGERPTELVAKVARGTAPPPTDQVAESGERPTELVAKVARAAAPPADQVIEPGAGPTELIARVVRGTPVADAAPGGETDTAELTAEPAPQVTSAEQVCPECFGLANELRKARSLLGDLEHRASEINELLDEKSKSADRLRELKTRLEAQAGVGATSVDPSTGVKIEAYDQGDGTVKITETDAEGLLVRETVRERESADQLEDEITTEKERLADLEGADPELRKELTEVGENIESTEKAVTTLERALDECVDRICNRRVDCEGLTHQVNALRAVDLPAAADTLDRAAAGVGCSLQQADAITERSRSPSGSSSGTAPGSGTVDQVAKAKDEDMCNEFCRGSPDGNCAATCMAGVLSQITVGGAATPVRSGGAPVKETLLRNLLVSGFDLFSSGSDATAAARSSGGVVTASAVAGNPFGPNVGNYSGNFGLSVGSTSLSILSPTTVGLLFPTPDGIVGFSVANPALANHLTPDIAFFGGGCCSLARPNTTSLLLTCGTNAPLCSNLGTESFTKVP